ncbi:MAG: SpoIID/LytB domain-containing protein [Clostridia bacterium]|nr:SpoIID/LytB domain-containing protein [Clostridia bacterium]
MILVKKRITAFALALTFCVGAAVMPSSAVAKTTEYNEPLVCVGMYVNLNSLDTRRAFSINRSESGFDIGFSNGDNGFVKAFSLSANALVLLPMRNAKYENGKVTFDENGNIGGYSAILGRFTSYQTAYNTAKAKGGFVAIVDGGYEARAYASNTEAEAKKASGGRSVVAPVSNGIYALDESGSILFSFEAQKLKLALRAQNGGAVEIPMRYRTGSTTYYEYRGFFEYKIQDNKLFMLNYIGLEEYTRCVMANEIGTNFSKETRKAFAVLARTVAVYAKHSGKGFDVCANSACCQVYHGIYRMSEENNALVESTRGLICTYKGAPITVLYHNSNGGASCSSVAAWGGDEVPYLKTVFQEEYDDGDKWTHNFTKEEFFEYITSRRTFSSLTDENLTVTIHSTDPYGSSYITALSITDGNGNTVLVETSEDVRSACGFTSANFTVEYNTEAYVLTADGKVEKKKIDGVLTKDGVVGFDSFADSYKTTGGSTLSPQSITVNGAGVGHGVGFSATGSEKLSKDGYSYKYILSFFFNGTDLTYAK